jgi:N-acyl-D-aspartate/D-glutamate deacylase
VIDGKGLVVALGFIDNPQSLSRPGWLPIPSQAETQIAWCGITTVVVGPDGDSPWLMATTPPSERSAPAVNVASFVGHADARRQVMKDDFQAPGPCGRARARMALPVDQGMREGAAGLSSV